MSIDELRAGFSRVATQARPTAEPYARLISRRRKRFRLRLASAAAALLAAAVSTPLALQAGSGGPTPPPAMELTTWTKRLIESPTRGNLAANTALIEELTQASIAKRAADQVPSELKQTKVLFADNTGSDQRLLVAHYSETHAYLVLRWAAPDAGVDQLVSRGPALHYKFGPFFVTTTSVEENRFNVFGLAPAGCEIVTADGPSPNRDYVVRQVYDGEVWRVVCDGRDMEASRAADNPRMALTHDMLESYTWLTGREGTARWDRDGLRVVAPQSGSGPAIVTIGERGRSSIAALALEPPGSATPARVEFGGPDRFLVGTGNAYANGDVVAVRVPQAEGDRVTISNRLLIVGPDGSRTEALGPEGNVLATVDLTEGMGYLTVDIGAATRIRVGSVTFDFPEPAAGPRMFEQPLFNNWG